MLEANKHTLREVAEADLEFVTTRKVLLHTNCHISS